MMKPIAATSAVALSLAASAAAEGVDFATYAPRLEARKIAREEAPTIDGDLSDAAWSKAAIVEDFYQVEPIEGGAPSQRTRAYLMYDERTLYVGFYLYDTDPSKIRRAILARDGQLRDEDAIRVMLDPYNTRRDGYFFATNANGAKVDALLENNSAIKLEWNALWNVDARIVEDGWIAEFAIPFQSI
ncbi:MAG: carbohydrate binding family 9 domain-containing protein [Parvularculaceae bacterium]|nr:carbohydrate binding family 9 domain-containing protein [Parvularculaceae bacterium]